MRRTKFMLPILIIICILPLCHIIVKHIKWRLNRTNENLHSLPKSDIRSLPHLKDTRLNSVATRQPKHHHEKVNRKQNNIIMSNDKHENQNKNMGNRRDEYNLNDLNKHSEKLNVLEHVTENIHDESVNEFKQDNQSKVKDVHHKFKYNSPNVDKALHGFKHHNQDKLCSFMKTYSADIKRRKRHLMNECSQKTPSNMTYNSRKTVFKNILICDEHKLLICVIPKAGSTFLRKLIYWLSEEGKPNAKDSKLYTFKKLSNLNSTDAEDKLRTYTKAIFTRDPMGRFYSAYSNKFVTVNPPYWAYGRKIIAQMRHNPDKTSQRCGHNITFEEFLKFVITEQQNLMDNPSYKMDQHWLPMSRSCDPCHINYDIIGKLASFNDDIMYMLCTLGAQRKVILPRKESLIVRKYTIMQEIKNSFKGWNEKLSKRKCLRRSELPKRIVRNLYQHGYLEYVPDTMEREVAYFNKDELTEYILKLVDESSTVDLLKLPNLRKEEAYKHIPHRLKKLLKDKFSDDFRFFGN